MGLRAPYEIVLHLETRDESVHLAKPERRCPFSICTCIFHALIECVFYFAYFHAYLAYGVLRSGWDALRTARRHNAAGAHHARLRPETEPFRDGF